jgi:hypothetical protein
LFQHHFLRNVMVAILRQRQLLVLHASCAVNCAKTVVVAGEPGAGKSTTMAALLTQGWRMVSDDVVALRLNDQECLEALPGAIHVYLHDDAAAALTVDTAGLPRSEWHRQKMALPLGESRSSTPGVVSKFIHLEKLTSHDLRTVHVTGHKKLPLLLRSLYGPISVGEIATRFDLFAAALRAVKMFSVARPDDSWTLDRVVALATDDETGMSDGIDYG